jgi:hypothetical protein
MVRRTLLGEAGTGEDVARVIEEDGGAFASLAVRPSERRSTGGGLCGAAWWGSIQLGVEATADSGRINHGSAVHDSGVVNKGAVAGA